MAEINRVALFGKLNGPSYKAVEGAMVFCKLRGNPYVELEHWLSQVMQSADSDWHRVIKHYGLDASALAKDMTTALDRLPRGATAISDIAEVIADSIERGWVYGSLLYRDSAVRSAYVLLGMLKTRHLRNALFAISRQFEKIKVDDFSDNLQKIVEGSPEDGEGASDGSSGAAGGAAPGEASGAIAPAGMGKQEALKKFTVDLTEQARSGKMDPIVGRDDEIRQVVDILMRRRQNNPILVGEAGVGKTAVVEGFAQRIARGDVPPSLKDVELRALDVGLLQAGASIHGLVARGIVGIRRQIALGIANDLVFDIRRCSRSGPRCSPLPGGPLEQVLEEEGSQISDVCVVVDSGVRRCTRRAVRPPPGPRLPPDGSGC